MQKWMQDFKSNKKKTTEKYGYKIYILLSLVFGLIILLIILVDFSKLAPVLFF